MALQIVEIMDTITAALETVLPGRVNFGRVAPYQPGELPVIDAQLNGEQVREFAIGTKAVQMTASVTIQLIQNSTQQTRIFESLTRLAEVQKALFTNNVLGQVGGVTNTAYAGHSFIYPDDGADVFVVELNLSVDYVLRLSAL